MSQRSALIQLLARTAWWQAVAGAPAVPPSLPFARMDEEKGILVDLHRTTIIDGKEVVEYRVQALQLSLHSIRAGRATSPPEPGATLRAGGGASSPFLRHRWSVHLVAPLHRFQGLARAGRPTVRPRQLPRVQAAALLQRAKDSQGAAGLSAQLRRCVHRPQRSTCVFDSPPALLPVCLHTATRPPDLFLARPLRQRR